MKTREEKALGILKSADRAYVEGRVEDACELYLVVSMTRGMSGAARALREMGISGQERCAKELRGGK
jgi:hypothetical protein